MNAMSAKNETSRASKSSRRATIDADLTRTLVSGPGAATVFAPATDETVVPELDAALFGAALDLMWELPPADAALGAVAAGRNAFGMVEAYLLPGFRASYESSEHDRVLDSTRSMQGSVVVMALGVTQNRVGREVQNYGVFWRDESDRSSLWHTNVVTLDPDRYGRIAGR